MRILWKVIMTITLKVPVMTHLNTILKMTRNTHLSMKMLLILLLLLTGEGQERGPTQTLGRVTSRKGEE
ncbi:unnamed protein product [Arctogadus glacialis]